MQIRTLELVGIKDLQCSLAAYVDKVNQGDLDKVLVTRRGRPIAVLLAVESYEHLVDVATEAIESGLLP